MPRLADLVEKRKFVKKEFRPWDLSGTGTVDGKTKDASEIFNNSDVIPHINQSTVLIEKPLMTEPERVNLHLGTGNVSNNVIGNKQITIREQRDNVQATKNKQPDNIKITKREQSNNTIGNITSNDDLTYFIDSIKKLSGIQKNIFLYIVDTCSARGILDTGNILSMDLALAAGCSVGSAKTSLQRLIEKHLIIRLAGKASRGGHMVLGISNEIQAATIRAQQLLFNPLKNSKTDNAIGNTSNNIGSYSSNKNIYTTTSSSLPDDWKKINFDILSHIGFSETQLRQLYESNITLPEIVQDAINRFAYSLEHNKKVQTYGDPLNVFMGVLRKGQRWNEPNYISPKELALKQLLEEKRKQKEQRDAMIKELVDLEFPDWRKKLSEVEIKNIVPAMVLKTNLSPAITAALRTYYIENVLLSKLEKMEVTE